MKVQICYKTNTLDRIKKINKFSILFKAFIVFNFKYKIFSEVQYKIRKR